jgi:diguanylate cyclase (GGDEF)-like protein
VLGLWAETQPSWEQLPLYLGALVAQFAFDLVSTLGFEWLEHSVRPGEIMPLLGRAYLADLTLAPAGLVAALAAGRNGFGFLPILSVVALMWMLARDRKEQIGNTIQAADAYETESVSGRTDELTGLANRRAWEEQVAAAAARCAGGGAVSVLLIDLDGLKIANDTRGHGFGDLLIKAVATIVRDAVAGDGFVARLGGDEVGVLLPDADELRCVQAITRIRAALAETPEVEGFPLSASIGGSSVPPKLTISDALAEADEQMYEQKRRSKLSRGHVAPQV